MIKKTDDPGHTWRRKLRTKHHLLCKADSSFLECAGVETQKYIQINPWAIPLPNSSFRVDSLAHDITNSDLQEGILITSNAYEGSTKTIWFRVEIRVQGISSSPQCNIEGPPRTWMQPNLFMNPLNKYLSSTYSIPDTVPSAGDTAVNKKIGKSLPSRNLHFSGRES